MTDIRQTAGKRADRFPVFLQKGPDTLPQVLERRPLSYNEINKCGALFQKRRCRWRAETGGHPMRSRICQAAILVELFLLFLLLCGRYADRQKAPVFSDNIEIGQTETKEGKKDYIKWVDFTVSSQALEYACEQDILAHEAGTELNWISLLAYTAARWGGEFSKQAMQTMRDMAEKALKEADGQRTATDVIEEAGRELKYYPYYKEAYEAVLSGMVGPYEAQIEGEDGTVTWQQVYGLKAYSPIAKGFDYSDYDDFGAARSYGYSRPHLGHDMMGLVGTPIIAIESGYVEVLGWNQYGGWRIGIRSFDRKRYYYYAHLRQNYPYQSDLEEGSVVTAGQVIGYMGHTGYSTEENVNNIKTTHLHWGLELIFDESQKESDNEIWIDCYQLSQFLRRHRSGVAKVEGTKEWKRVLQIRDPAAEAAKK